jgi:hypothetical protein
MASVLRIEDVACSNIGQGLERGGNLHGGIVPPQQQNQHGAQAAKAWHLIHMTFNLAPPKNITN